MAGNTCIDAVPDGISFNVSSGGNTISIVINGGTEIGSPDILARNGPPRMGNVGNAISNVINFAFDPSNGTCIGATDILGVEGVGGDASPAANLFDGDTAIGSTNISVGI